MCKKFSCFLLGLLLIPYGSWGQAEVSLSTVIHETIGAYPFSSGNAFRLAAYAELKGQYEQYPFSLTLPFGALGSMRFYRQNCLLRTESGQVFTLDPKRDSPVQARYLDAAISHILEQIMLLGQEGVASEKRAFVDRHLARKNIEPFAKLYLRHVLLYYGRFDQRNGRITLHTDWLPVDTYAYRSPGDTVLVRRPTDPLMVNLDGDILRGYYLKSGGTVYVENVTEGEAYVSGEVYAYNVAAFKLFAQKIFAQTTHYITGREKARLVELVDIEWQAPDESPDIIDLGSPRQVDRGNSRGSASSLPARPNVQQLRPQAILPPGYRRTRKKAWTGPRLYGENSWVYMMLTILRQKGLNIGDPDILPYFIQQPYFNAIYARLTDEERKAVDAYRRSAH